MQTPKLATSAFMLCVWGLVGKSLPIFASHASHTGTVFLGTADRPIIVPRPSQEEVEQILEHNAKIDFVEEMKNYMVGMQGCVPMTLAEAYRKKLVTSTEAAAIQQHVMDFKDGQIGLLKIQFGTRSGQMVLVGRYPASLLPRPKADEPFDLKDQSLVPFTKWLELFSHMLWNNTPTGGGLAGADPTTGFSYDQALAVKAAAALAYNYYSPEHQRSLYGEVYQSPNALGGDFWVSQGNTSQGLWLSAMYGWAGLGYGGSYNINEHNVTLAALGGGLFVAGWKDYVQAGISVSAALPNGDQFGLGSVISVSKNRLTSYLRKYNGEFDTLIDAMIKAYDQRKQFFENELIVTERLLDILKDGRQDERAEFITQENEKIRGEIQTLEKSMSVFEEEKASFGDRHFIQVVDSQGKGFRITPGVYAGGVGLGFWAAAKKNHNSVYRFYAPLQRAQELLRDGNGEKIALLRIPEEFDRKEFPDVLKPHKWRPGEEVVTTVERNFNGSIVVGLFGLPAFTSRVGISATVTGSFEIGVRRLPGNKLEVTMRPVEIMEMGGFITTISTFGPQMSAAASVALAMRQTFIFDLDNPEAVDTYMMFMNAGVLPIDFSLITDLGRANKVENFLDIAALARKNLAKKGVLLTHLEKVDVPARRFSAAIGKLPCINQRYWVGLSYDYLNSLADVMSTNGEIAIARSTSHVQESFGQGTSGTRTYGAYATLKQTYTKTKAGREEEEAAQTYPDGDGYTWRFGGLILRARFADDKVTGFEQNKMIDKLNLMFRANIRRFPPTSRGHKQTREILLERELTSKDLDGFKTLDPSVLEPASRASGIDKGELVGLLERVNNRGHNQIASILRDFVGKYGLKGMAAVHLMLNGGCRNLVLRAETDSYTTPVTGANTLEILYTDPRKEGASQFLDLNEGSAESKVNKVFTSVKEVIGKLDLALADLDEDPFFEAPGDILKFGKENLREKQIGLRSLFLATKNRMLDLIDLEKQGFLRPVMVKIYSKIKEAERDVFQRFVLLEDRYLKKIDSKDLNKDVFKRWNRVKKLVADIDKEMAALNNENKRRILGELFVERRLGELRQIREKALALLAVDHMEAETLEGFRDKMKEKAGLFDKAHWQAEIVGKLESVIQEKKTQRERHASQAPMPNAPSPARA